MSGVLENRGIYVFVNLRSCCLRSIQAWPSTDFRLVAKRDVVNAVCKMLPFPAYTSPKGFFNLAAHSYGETRDPDDLLPDFGKQFIVTAFGRMGDIEYWQVRNCISQRRIHAPV